VCKGKSILLIHEDGNLKNSGPQDVVGLIPAAGTGSRIAPLPMSKELFPIGFQSKKGEDLPRPKVISHYLLDKFAKADIRKTFIIIRNGKWDIPAYFGDGSFVNMHLGYLMMGESFGPPYTLDQAYPFVQNKVIAFGFPDILFEPEDVFSQLLDRQESMQSDIVLALYPAHNSKIMDMVDVEGDGTIRAMYLKPDNSELKYCWLCAVWTPVFTQFMHDFLKGNPRGKDLGVGSGASIQDDLTVGAVIKAAVNQGLTVHGVTFPQNNYIDIGTPEDLVKSVNWVD
jgi:glucose-1-phosphate thymidylyltransferase